MQFEKEDVMSEITFDQIKAFQDQLDQHPASGALGRAVQNVTSRKP